MKIDWREILGHLDTYPTGTHTLLAPCPTDRIVASEKEIGALPDSLKEMLAHFNGAELFVDALPFVTLFALTVPPQMSAQDWAPDWYIDKYTKAWRSAGGQPGEWAIAMTSYGGLFILDSKDVVREWDTGSSAWGPTQWIFPQWVKQLLVEGDAAFNED